MEHFLSQTLLLILFVAGIYVALPVAIVWGCVKWAKRTSRPTVFSTLSLIGFSLATASALLALSSLVYAQAIHGFPFYDRRLLRTYASGGLLSLSGMAFGLSGVWRPSPLRWFAPICAAGMLLFWFAMAVAE
jgi:hypothetical protein